MHDKKLIERMKTLLAYDPETGLFIWKVSNSNRIKVGDVAGTIMNRGYINIQVDGKIYKAHRIAFAFEHGYFPLEIDHKNRNKTDNRIKNLREATSKENGRNKSMPKNNTSGITGVHWDKREGKWYAQIGVDGKKINLGYFTHKHEAIQSRSEANRKYGFSRGHGFPKQTTLMEVA